MNCHKPLKWSGLCLGLSLFAGLVCDAQDQGRPLSKVVFGSCCKQDQPQPIWDAIVAEKPELFLMIGDNIYGDSTDMAVLRAKWGQLNSSPGFMRLKQSCPVLGIWDDHDYGADDAGAEFPFKKESQQLFLDAFGVSADSPLRKQDGVYASYEYGPNEQRVQVILLDTRYHRSELKKNNRKKTDPGYLGPYTKNGDPGATILGETQWSWFHEQLKRPAKVRIIASSIQVLPNQHYWEKWGNFPADRVRFMQAVRDSKASGAIIISGDRHSCEISRNDRLVGYPLFEVTSSSLNAPAKPKEEPNRDRVGKLYGEVNFGMLSIDWSKTDPVITLELRAVDGKQLESQSVRLSELAAK